MRRGRLEDAGHCASRAEPTSLARTRQQEISAMAPGTRRFVLRAAVFLLAANGLVHAMQCLPPALAQSPPSRPGAAAKPLGGVGYGTTRLPEPVIEMRDAILTAARSGRIEELRTAIELNEIKGTSNNRTSQ